MRTMTTVALLALLAVESTTAWMPVAAGPAAIPLLLARQRLGWVL
jgi:hypothetical protein